MKRKLLYLALLGVIVFSAFPLYFSIIVSTKDNSALSDVSMLPGANLMSNIKRVFETVPFDQAIINSVIVSGTVTLSVVMFSTLAGFAFAKLQFRWRTGLLLAVVATMMSARTGAVTYRSRAVQDRHARSLRSSRTSSRTRRPTN